MMRWVMILAAVTVLSMPAMAQRSFYVGGAIGNTTVETEFSEFNFNFLEDDFSWSAFAGIRASDIFAVEAGYNDFGNFSEVRNIGLTSNEIDAELTGFDIVAVVSLPLGPVKLFGKGGIVFWDIEANALVLLPVGPAFELREDDDGSDFTFGGGVEFRLGPELSLRGELDWFDIEDTQRVLFGSVGVTYRF